MTKTSDLVPGRLDMLLPKIPTLALMNGFAVSERLKQVAARIGVFERSVKSTLQQRCSKA